MFVNPFAVDDTNFQSSHHFQFLCKTLPFRIGHEAAGDECQVSGLANVEGLAALSRSLTNVGRWPDPVVASDALPSLALGT